MKRHTVTKCYRIQHTCGIAERPTQAADIGGSKKDFSKQGESWKGTTDRVQIHSGTYKLIIDFIDRVFGGALEA